MASTTVGKLKVFLGLESSQFSRGMRTANKRVGLMSSGVGKLAAGLGALFAGRKIIGGMKEVLDLFGKQELAERRMAEGLKLAGDTAASSLNDFKRFASEIQSITTFGDEAVLEIAALGASLGRMSGGELKDATKAAIGLSKAAGIDAASAMKLLARGAQGGTVDFSRYGIVVDKTKSKQEQFNEVLKAGLEGFKLATAEADTTSGRLQQLSNTIGDLKENIGSLIALPLKGFLDDLKTLTDSPSGLKIGLAEGLAGILDTFDLEKLATGETGKLVKELRSAAEILRRVDETSINSGVRQNGINEQNRNAANARKAYMESEIAASRQRVQERFKNKYGITGGEFFDFTARSGLYDFNNKLSNISPISALSNKLLGAFNRPDPSSLNTGPQFAGALARGTTAEYSARLAASGGGVKDKSAMETAENTSDTASNTSKLVELFKNFNINQSQSVQIVSI